MQKCGVYTHTRISRVLHERECYNSRRARREKLCLHCGLGPGGKRHPFHVHAEAGLMALLKMSEAQSGAITVQSVVRAQLLCAFDYELKTFGGLL